MKKLAALSAALLLFAGCGGWQKTTTGVLQGLFEAGKLSRAIAVEQQHEKCKAIAAKCGAETPGKCPELKPCQDARHKIEAGFVTVNRFIAAALLATQLGKKEEALALVVKTKDQLAKLKAELEKLGVL